MTASLLELNRQSHEDLERYQDVIRMELDAAPSLKTPREIVSQSHRINTYLERLLETRDKLIELYEDKDGTRREELQSIIGTGPGLFTLFYDRLRELKEFHRRFPGMRAEHSEERILIDEPEGVLKEVPFDFVNRFSHLVSFTDEECYGKCLDLHEFYEAYVNLKRKEKKSTKDGKNQLLQQQQQQTKPTGKKEKDKDKKDKEKEIDYLGYLNTFFQFTMKDSNRRDREYRQYLKGFFDYLVHFIERAQPLFDLQKTLKEINDTFEKKWQSGEYLHAILESIKQPEYSQSNQTSASTSSSTNSLFCKACNKTFSKDTVFNAHLAGKKHIKASQKLDNSGASMETAAPPNTENTVNVAREVCFLQFGIQELAKHLKETIDDSKANVVKKQTLAF